jgi:hypothetical protein
MTMQLHTRRRRSLRSPSAVIRRQPLATVGARGFPTPASGSRLGFRQSGHVLMSDSTAPPASSRLGRFRLAHGEFATLCGDAYVKTGDGLPGARGYFRAGNTVGVAKGGYLVRQNTLRLARARSNGSAQPTA